MSAYKVKPDPFWKSVRPVVPKDVIYGTFVTAKTYTTCFTGVVVPYVCTSGCEGLRQLGVRRLGTEFHRLQLLPAARSFSAPRRRSRLTLATTNGKLSVTMFCCDGVEAGFNS